MQALRIALVGIGKIARDQHLPAIAADPAFELVATVSRHGGIDGVRNFGSVEELVASDITIDAVSLCTPPVGRHAIAARAIAAGWHVMLEKPPAVTLGDVEDLIARAERAGITLYASWHSRAAAGVDSARRWLAQRAIRAVRIEWLEDIRQWHPGQEWILAPGGFGVFDPGINALSILTTILPGAVRIDRSVLDVPANRTAPVAARLTGHCGEADLAVRLDFLKTGDQQWTIDVDTDSGKLRLSEGGAVCTIDGVAMETESTGEYPRLYHRFRQLVAERRSDVDLNPLRIVADALLVAETIRTDSFDFE
jgi:predicted dehydrogenase